MTKLADLPAETQEVLRSGMCNALLPAGLLVPGTDPKAIDAKVDAFIDEDLQIAEQIIPALLEPDRISSFPYMQLIANLQGGGADTETAFTVTKDPGPAASTEDILTKALFYAFLVSPAARLFLILSGFTYRFQDVKQLAKKLIIKK